MSKHAGDIKHGDDAQGPLSELAEKMIDIAEETNPDVKAIVMITTEDSGGLALYGYDGAQTMEVLEDVFAHAEAIAHVGGRNLAIFPMPTPGNG